MRIAILSRNRGLHSVRRLLAEAKKARVDCDVINPLDCQLIIDGKDTRIMIGSEAIPEYDVVLPRIGASITDYGLAVVKHLECLGGFPFNSAQAISDSRNKMRCLQILAGKGLAVPATVLTRSARGRRNAVEAVRGLPVVLKLLKGTQGLGVMLLNHPISVGSVLDTLDSLDQDVIIQQFIAEGAGRDYRAFVIGDRVVAAMMRTAAEGEFRSNIHRGGHGRLIKLPPAYERAAIRASSVLGLHLAGVDLMESSNGPMILEVNSSPGFEGIERATGLNIAGMIMKEMIRAARKRKKGARSKR